MKIELALTGRKDAYLLKNLYPLYIHDISEFEEIAPNRHGVLGDDPALKTLGEQGERQREWWRKPEALFPYLILADGRPVGFDLISTRPYLPEGIAADFVVHGFFLVHAYRGRGVGEAAAIEGFERHPGTWEVVTYPPHARAVAFWRKVLRRYAPGDFAENEVDHPWGRKVAFTFDNRA